MNHDEMTEVVAKISRRVAAQPRVTEANFPMFAYAAVRDEAPEVIEYLKQQQPLSDAYQALKWFIPDDLGFRIT